MPATLVVSTQPGTHNKQDILHLFSARQHSQGPTYSSVQLDEPPLEAHCCSSCSPIVGWEVAVFAPSYLRGHLRQSFNLVEIVTPHPVVRRMPPTAHIHSIAGRASRLPLRRWNNSSMTMYVGPCLPCLHVVRGDYRSVNPHVCFPTGRYSNTLLLVMSYAPKSV